MSAAELLSIVAMKGVVLVLEGGQLICRADHQPPADLLASIKAHKLELIEALSAASDPAKDDPDLDHAAIDQSQIVDEPQQFIHTAATASPEWITARDQYIGHLMACRDCYAPTSRYCASGANLRLRYNTISEEQVDDDHLHGSYVDCLEGSYTSAGDELHE